MTLTGVIGGVQVAIETRFCFQFVYYVNAVLVWDGPVSLESRVVGEGPLTWQCDVANVVVL